MKTKNIKVVYSNRMSSHSMTAYPKIQMEGRWLEELGFSIGTRLVVEYEKGSIRIRPFTKEEITICREQEMHAELERKRAE